MSKLEELFAQLCPNGVEYLKIGEVVNYEQPSKYIVHSTDYNDDFEVPVLTAGQTFILGYINEKSGIYNASKEAPVIIFDDFTGAFKWVDFPFKVKSSAMKILTVDDRKTFLRYIFHVMGHIGYSSAEHKRLWIGLYSEFEIPVPPMPVQKEIVRILDSFTNLTAELTAELTARKKQYEYYRRTFIENVSDLQPFSLGDLATIKTGSKPKEILDIPTEYEYINAGTSNSGYTKSPNCSGDTVTTPSRGQGGIGFVGYQKQSFWLGPLCYQIQAKDSNIVLNRYLYHYLTCFNEKILAFKKEGGTPAVNASDLMRINIDVPPIVEQQRIVDILERFDALCNDISAGLPAEIEARQKQYEYYRDKLLTFKESSC